MCWAEDWWPVIIHGAEIVKKRANVILVGLDPDEAIVGVFSGLCRHEKPHYHFEIFDFFILIWYFDDHYVNFANCVSTVLVGSVEASNVYICESLPVLQLRMLKEAFEPAPYTAVHITELDLILLQEIVEIWVSRDDFINMNEGNLRNIIAVYCLKERPSLWFIEAVNDKPILVRLLQIGLALQNKQQGWFDVDTKLEQLPIVKRTDDLCKQFVLLRCDGV